MNEEYNNDQMQFNVSNNTSAGLRKSIDSSASVFCYYSLVFRSYAQLHNSFVECKRVRIFKVVCIFLINWIRTSQFTIYNSLGWLYYFVS